MTDFIKPAKELEDIDRAILESADSKDRELLREVKRKIDGGEKVDIGAILDYAFGGKIPDFYRAPIEQLGRIPTIVDWYNAADELDNVALARQIHQVIQDTIPAGPRTPEYYDRELRRLEGGIDVDAYKKYTPDQDIAQGRHSGIPECCITQYINSTEEQKIQQNQRAHNAEQEHGLGHYWDYMPCDECLDSMHAVKIHYCHPGCGLEEIRDACGLSENQIQNIYAKNELNSIFIRAKQ